MRKAATAALEAKVMELTEQLAEAQAMIEAQLLQINEMKNANAEFDQLQGQNQQLAMEKEELRLEISQMRPRLYELEEIHAEYSEFWQS